MPLPAGGIAAVLLAAGAGSRLGGGKLLLPWRGKPLVVHAAATAASVPAFRSLIVVTGCDAPKVAEALREHLPDGSFFLAENRRWEEGMGSSLRLGLETALSRSGVENKDEYESEGEAGIAGVMFLLGDQPLVRRETLEALLHAHGQASRRDPGHAATAPTHAGRRGNPVILSRRLFPTIRTLQGDIGARNILSSLGDGLLPLPVDDPGVCLDVDSPEAYARLLAGYGSV